MLLRPEGLNDSQGWAGCLCIAALTPCLSNSTAHNNLQIAVLTLCVLKGMQCDMEQDAQRSEHCSSSKDVAAENCSAAHFWLRMQAFIPLFNRFDANVAAMVRLIQLHAQCLLIEPVTCY